MEKEPYDIIILLFVTYTLLFCPESLTGKIYLSVDGSPLSECPSDQYRSNGGKCCHKCPPGFTVKYDCIENSYDGKCERCPPGYYTSAPSGLSFCHPLTHCDHSHEYIYRKSNGTTDNKCRCKKGYHYNSESKEVCLQNPLCPPGRGIKKGKCEACQEGTYSDRSSRIRKCVDQPNCEALGLQVLTPGNSTKATECYNATESLTVSVYPTTDDSVNQTAVLDDDSGNRESDHDTQDYTPAVTLSVAFTVIIVAVVSAVTCVYKRKKKSTRKSLRGELNEVVQGNGCDEHEQCEPLQNDTSTRHGDRDDDKLNSDTVQGGCLDEYDNDVPTRAWCSEPQNKSVDDSKEDNTSPGMREEHRNLIRQNTEHLIKDLDTRIMLDKMIQDFTEEDEANIMNQMLSAHDQRRKFLSILLTKGPDAFPRFVQNLKVVNPHLVNAFEKYEP